jgi:hypothetical protein
MIQKVFDDAKDGTLTIQECVAILAASEGVAANSVWGAPGHPLQHSAQVTGSPTFRRIEDSYHFRGPVPIQKELKGGPNVGHFKAAIKIEDDGSVTAKSNTFHSQFQDDDQAGMCLKMAPSSKAGRWALDLLRTNARVSVSVTFGMPGGTKYLNRTSQLVGAGIPTSNIIHKDDMEHVQLRAHRSSGYGIGGRNPASPRQWVPARPDPLPIRGLPRRRPQLGVGQREGRDRLRGAGRNEFLLTRSGPPVTHPR